MIYLTIKDRLSVNASNSRYLLIILMLLSLPATHAEPYMQQNISLSQAQKVVAAAINECGLINGDITVSVAVVDRAGQPVMQIRSDNSAPHNWELAFRKAYTARTYRRTSLEWRDRTAGNSERAGQRQLSQVIPLGGGAPIKAGNDTIGGVGVTGAEGGQPADDACAVAAAASIASELQ